MIKSFRHKGLAELFEAGQSRRVRQALQSGCLRRLEALDQAEVTSDLNVPGFNFHGLHGSPKRYSIHVNGPLLTKDGQPFALLIGIPPENVEGSLSEIRRALFSAAVMEARKKAVPSPPGPSVIEDEIIKSRRDRGLK